jgi:hypothetical protein
MALRLDGDRATSITTLHRNLTGTPTESCLEQVLSVRHPVGQRAVFRGSDPRAILHCSGHHTLCLIEESELDEDERDDKQDREGNCRLDQCLAVLTSPSGSNEQTGHGLQLPML